MGDIGAGAVLRQNGAARGGGGPLGRGRPLVAVGHRHPVLPLGGAEMGTGNGGDPAGIAAVNDNQVVIDIRLPSRTSVFTTSE